MWADNESEFDLLRFQYMSQTITKVIRDGRLLPTTVGVFGDWGSGKSTLLRLIQDDLESDGKTCVIRFSGWLFEGYEDAKGALMGTLLDEIQKSVDESKTLSESVKADVQKRVAKLFRRVNLLKAAGMAAKFAIPSLLAMQDPTLGSIAAAGTMVVSHLGSALEAFRRDPDAKKIEEAQKAVAEIMHNAPESIESTRTNIRAFRHEFEELIAKTGLERVVVMIDDLDRCLPDTLIETLEAVKLFLYVPKTAYLFAVDELLVQYAIRRQIPIEPDGTRDVGRDYLEKLIQIPVRIPKLSKSETESYMNLLYAEKHLRGDDGNTEVFQSVLKHVAEFPLDDVNARYFDRDHASKVCSTNYNDRFEKSLGRIADVAPVVASGLGGSPRRIKRFLNSFEMRLDLSAARKIKIDPRVLAKLMALEEVKLPLFRVLANLQSRESGFSKDLKIAESRIVSTKKTEVAPEPTVAEGKGKPATPIARSVSVKGNVDEAISSTVETWILDSWMRTWLASEPKLADTDLRPYFYVAHDRLDILATAAIELSERAAKLIAGLLAKTDAERSVALKTLAPTIELFDLGAVFETLAQRIEGGGDSAQTTHVIAVCELLEVRKELAERTLELFEKLNAKAVPYAQIPRVINIWMQTESLRPRVINVLERLAKAGAGPVTNAAKTQLDRIKKKSSLN
jgi:KAP family P-loop domain